MTASFPAASRLALACTLASSLVVAPAWAQDAQPAAPAPAESPAPPPAPPAPSAKPDPTVSQDAEALVVAPPAPATKPLFALGSETYFIAPVLSLAGGIHSEHLLVNPSPGKESRVTTAALSRLRPHAQSLLQHRPQRRHRRRPSLRGRPPPTTTQCSRHFEPLSPTMGLHFLLRETESRWQ